MLLALAGEARADECDARAAEMIARIGGKVERRTDSGNILMKHPLASSISIQCANPNFPISLSSYAATAYPSAAFYDLTAEAGAIVTGLPADMIREGLIRCQGRALKSADESTDMNYRQVRLECQASVGSAGRSGFTVYRKRPADS